MQMPCMLALHNPQPHALISELVAALPNMFAVALLHAYLKCLKVVVSSSV